MNIFYSFITQYFNKYLNWIINFFGFCIICEVTYNYPSNHFGGYDKPYFVFTLILLFLLIVVSFIQRKINIGKIIICLILLLFFFLSDPFSINLTYEEFCARGLPEWGQYVPKNERNIILYRVVIDDNIADDIPRLFLLLILFIVVKRHIFPNISALTSKIVHKFIN